MGVAVGDVDGDGRIDIFVTNYSMENNTLYLNRGDCQFEDSTIVRGLAGGESFRALGWSTMFFDRDHDGDLDLFVANGHVNPRAGEVNHASGYEQRCFLFSNNQGHFAAPELLGPPASYRAAALGDWNRDGSIDILLSRQAGLAVLLESTANFMGSVSVRLEGSTSNSEGIGALLTLTVAGKRQVRVVSRGGGYLSAHDASAHFGLGASKVAESLEVIWPSRRKDKVGPLLSGKRYVVVEGSGVASIAN